MKIEEHCSERKQNNSPGKDHIALMRLLSMAYLNIYAFFTHFPLSCYRLDFDRPAKVHRIESFFHYYYVKIDL